MNDRSDSKQKFFLFCLEEDTDRPGAWNLEKTGMAACQSIVENHERVGTFQSECENFLLSMAKIRGEAQEREVRNHSDLDPRKYADVGQLNTTPPACFDLADDALWKDQLGIKSGQKMEQTGLM